VAITQIGTPAALSGTNLTSSSPVTGIWNGTQTLTAGDLLVAVVTASAATSVTATAQNSGTTGWTKLYEVWNSTTNAGHCLVAIWTKTATGADAAPSFTSTLTGAGGMACALYQLDGGAYGIQADTYGTESSSGSGTGTATIASTAVTTNANVAASGEFAIMGATRRRAAIATTITGSASWTLDVNDGANSTTYHTGVQSYANPPSGATLSGTVSYSSTSTTAYGAGLTVVFTANIPVSGPALNQPCSQPAGFRTVLARVGMAMASVIPVVAAAPPPPVTSGPPVYPLHQPVSVHRALPPRGHHAARKGQGVTLTQGPPAAPLHRPVSAITRPLPARGRVIASFTRAQAPVPPPPAPVYPLTRPVSARVRVLPPRGVAHKRAGQGVPQTRGVPFPPLRQPVKAAQPRPPAGWAQTVAVAGINPVPNIGGPFPPLTQPVSVRRTLPARGRTAGNKGAPVQNPLPPGTGAAFPAWHGPFTARHPLPPRGAAYGRSGQGVPQTRGVPFPPPTKPVAAARPLPPRGTTATRSGQGIPQAQGTPVPPLTQPVTARVRVLPPKGTAAARKGQGVPQTPGPALTPLRSPVAARRPLPPHGTACGRTGQGIPQTRGVPFPALTRPVTATRPLPPRGRSSGNVGAPVQNPAPPVTGAVFPPLRQPVTARRPVTLAGRAAAVTAVWHAPVPVPASGPPVPALTQPVSIKRTLPARGRSSGNIGAPVVNPGPPPTSGPPVTPLRQPVSIRRTLPARGRNYGNPGGVPIQLGGYFPPRLQPAGLRVTYLRTGEAKGSAGAPVQNPLPPTSGPALPPLRSPVQARQPLPRHGYALADIPAGYAPVPVTSGPPAAPLRQPAGIRRTLPSRGRAYGNPGAPVVNPVITTGARVPPLTSPVSAVRPAASLQGRAMAVVAVFRTAAPATSGPPLTPLHAPVRTQITLPPRGHAKGSAGAPVQNPLPPGAGAPFPPLRQPARTRITLPPRGTARGSQGAPVRNPAVPARLYPLRGPVCPVRPPAFLHGRAMAAVAIPAPRNPQPGAPFPARHNPVSIRFTLPPRGWNTGNRGAAVNNPPSDVVYAAGAGRVPWTAGDGRLRWAAGAGRPAWTAETGR